jgi:uncharacterized protein YyaL (SSP411 family)
MTSARDPRHTPNRLAREKSPYLLQHAHNPVDWYPWGDEAFEKARRENQPVFLSIGYSTCHWCHVMERESFESDAVAAVLNRDFVPIKVDREERPDVDRIYMNALMAMGLGGGWPLTAFLTPDLKPFYGGTYFPPDARYGRPGLIQVLERIHEVWTERRAEVESTGAQIFAHLAAGDRATAGAADREALFEAALHSLAVAADPEHGGFGQGQKFPSPSNLVFLMRMWARDPARRSGALALVLRQLDAMRAGGIHDHLGGGFHRYTVDPAWMVPHFEKMLYDQAQMVWACLEAFQATGRPEYAEVARGVLDYVARDLGAPEGGFYSAEDADSEGEEGKFYVWTPAEVEAIAGEDAAAFSHRYGVTEEGNFEHGTSILHEAHTLEETASHLGRDIAETEAAIARARRKLFDARARRVRPYRDDKVITAWNGLMISAFARAARVLDDPALARRGERAADFLWERLFDPTTGTLERRYRDGDAGAPGQLDDYANFAAGLLDLYAATFDPKWLERAARVTEAQIDRFRDDDGGFFVSPAGDPHVTLRLKDEHDGAEAAGNSVAAHNLLALAGLLDRDDWRALAARALDRYARRLSEHPAAMPLTLAAMVRAESASRHVVIAGDPAAADTRAMVREFNRRFLPHDELILSGGEGRSRLQALAPFAARLEPRDGRATAYLCVDYACGPPITSPAEFAARLDDPVPLVHSESPPR